MALFLNYTTDFEGNLIIADRLNAISSPELLLISQRQYDNFKIFFFNAASVISHSVEN